MADIVSSKRLILRAVLRQVNPMVIRLISVSDQLQLSDLHDIFRVILDWDGDLGYIVRIQGRQTGVRLTPDFLAHSNTNPSIETQPTVKVISVGESYRCI